MPKRSQRERFIWFLDSSEKRSRGSTEFSSLESLQDVSETRLDQVHGRQPKYDSSRRYDDEDRIIQSSETWTRCLSLSLRLRLCNAKFMIAADDDDDSSLKAPFTFSAWQGKARQGEAKLTSFVPGSFLSLLFSLSYARTMLARFISADPEIIFRFGLSCSPRFGLRRACVRARVFRGPSPRALLHIRRPRIPTTIEVRADRRSTVRNRGQHRPTSSESVTHVGVKQNRRKITDEDIEQKMREVE